MNGRVCVVTGANSGIGKATARALARMGAIVVLACRSLERGEAARREIGAETRNPNLDLMHLDLADFSSVRAFATAFAANYPKLHVLANNAGIYTSRRRMTVDRFERTFQVNYLSHYLLTHLLLDRLKGSAPARIVNVSSEASQIGRIAFDDLNVRRWSGLRAYAQSKLAQILFTKELARRLDGTGVVVHALHPGGVRTNWAKGGRLMRLGYWLSWPFLLSPAKGADTVVWLASSPDADGASGQYFYRRRPIPPKAIANDPVVARRLWDVSATLTGLRTTLPPENTL
ncbi:MAG: SDR family oxidoreductase [Euryarchaeota archaeon]|nr:SDR family oxidoreductase [Euryarchaeota archaeon]